MSDTPAAPQDAEQAKAAAGAQLMSQLYGDQIPDASQAPPRPPVSDPSTVKKGVVPVFNEDELSKDYHSLSALADPPKNEDGSIKLGELYVGCGVIRHDDWRGGSGAFVPPSIAKNAKAEKAYYMRMFNFWEVNSTFYGGPKHDQVRDWASSAPPGFVYSVKVNKGLTHETRFEDPATYWERLWGGLQLLGRQQIGPILFQFPGSFGVEHFASVARLSSIIPPGLKLAFDFRSTSWNTATVNAWLARNNWTRVIGEHPSIPTEITWTANYCYIRMHGPGELHASEYTEAAMGEWAEEIVKWRRTGRDVFVAFNNDTHGYGPKNAAQLKKAVRALTGEPVPGSEKRPMGMNSIMSMFGAKSATSGVKRSSVGGGDDKTGIKKAKN